MFLLGAGKELRRRKSELTLVICLGRTLVSTVTAAAIAGDYQAAVAASLPLVWKA